MPRAARTAGSCRCPHRRPPTPAAPIARGTAPAEGCGVSVGVGRVVEVLPGRSLRGDFMRAAPERPEEDQTQSTNSTYKERGRSTQLLKNEPKRDAAGQCRDSGERMVDAESAAATPTSCRGYERPLRTLRQSRHEPHGQEQ